MALEDNRRIVMGRLDVTVHGGVQMAAANAVALLFAEAHSHGYPEPNLDTIRLSLETVGRPGLKVTRVRASARCGSLTGECPSCHAGPERPHTDYCRQIEGEPPSDRERHQGGPDAFAEFS